MTVFRMIIPARAISPSSATNPNGLPERLSAREAPMMPSGAVRKTRSSREKLRSPPGHRARSRRREARREDSPSAGDPSLAGSRPCPRGVPPLRSQARASAISAVRRSLVTWRHGSGSARAAPAHQFGREPYDVLARADEVDRVKVAMSRDIPRNPSRGRVWVQVIGVGGLALFFLLRLSI